MTGSRTATPTARLREPSQRVSRRAIAYWTTRAALGWVLLLAGQLAWLLADGGHRTVHVIVLVVTALLTAAHCVVMPQWRFRVHRWETTSTAVYTQSGWFDQERRIAPISRIQTVDSERGPIEAVFGLANVTVTTASAAGPLTINGLDRATAERLVDELTAVTEVSVGDAT